MVIKEELKGILKEYKQKIAAYDEFWLNQDTMHPHWANFMNQLSELGLSEINERNLELQRLLKDGGVTYNLYKRKDGITVPWKLDPIPYLIAPHIWDMIEKGVKQRATLLDCLLKDLYGERKVLKEGVLPGELLYIDRNFLRPCVPYRSDSSHQLLKYAADISRSTDGRLWVIGDRTQAPSGWSYMMVNRMAMARIIPELFVGSQIKKIVPFFQRLRSNLISFSPRKNENPLIVLLTSGTLNETYFEHGYLASLQGYTLAKGEDLMVKNGFLWLKTLGGLERVDILVRHVDDNYCDPVSLRQDSRLGVAGLMDVVRKGNITIANPLGSGVLQNPGFMAFMPKICQYYLNEDLILPNIATWWCGHKQPMNYVLANLEKLVIKRLDRREGQRTKFGWKLSTTELYELRKKIMDKPYLFVAQEQAIFSTSPSLAGSGEIEPHHTVLRCFAVASQEGYQVLPGGLSRSAPEVGNTHVSSQSGGSGKDTWVLSSENIQLFGFKFDRNRETKYTYRGIEDLSSGIASNMFWIGRYMKRTLLTVNLLRRTLRYFAEIENFKDPLDNEILSQLLQSLTHSTLTYPGFVGEKGIANRAHPEPEVRSLIVDVNRVGSLSNTVKMLRNSANNIRNIWSIETWRVLDKVSSICDELCADSSLSIRSIRKKLDELLDGISACFGFIQNTLSVEAGGPLHEIGVDLEDGIIRSALLRSALTFQLDERVEDELLETILLVTGNLSTYKHRYRGDIQIIGVLELILLDQYYPGSLTVSLSRLVGNLEILPQRPLSGGLRADQKLVLQLLTDLKTSDALELAKTNEEDLFRSKLDTLLDNLRGGMVECSNLIVNQFFQHTAYKSQRSEFLFDPGF